MLNNTGDSRQTNVIYDGPQLVIEGFVFDYTGEYATPNQFIKAMEGIHNNDGTNYRKYMTDFYHSHGRLFVVCDSYILL